MVSITKRKINILCVIPARRGSKGLKNKNIIPIFGKPLISHTIEAALESKLINKIVVSTDGKKIAKLAVAYKIQVIERPKKYATDSAPIEGSLRHAVKYLEDKEGYVPDIVVFLQANIPIRKRGQIDKIINRLITTDADSAATIYPVTQYPQWMKIMDRDGFLFPLFPEYKKYRRQNIKPMFLLDGAAVAIKRKVLMETECRRGVHVFMGKKIVGIIQDKKYTIEVDNREDLELVIFFLARNKGS